MAFPPIGPLIFYPRFWPQTQQGADIVAETLQAKVIMPDCFDGYVQLFTVSSLHDTQPVVD